MIPSYFNLDVLQKVSSILGSLSIVVVISTYFYNRKKDKRLAAIDQITFFREKIIVELDKVSKMIKEDNPGYWFSRIKLDSYNIEEIKKTKSRNFDNQLSIIFDITKIDPITNNTGIKEILSKQITLLNMIEEFSLRVKHLGTQKHPSLESICSTFVLIVEQNAVAILFEREIIADYPMYSNTLELYSLWKDDFNKTNWINNLEKHNFMNKEEKERIFKIQRSNNKK